MPSAAPKGSGIQVRTTLTDELGRIHQIDSIIGRGGQGVVYSLKGGRLAAKVLSEPSLARRERLRSKLGIVRRMPLQDLPIARPMELLAAPQAGYVMPLLTGVVPLIDLHRAKLPAKSDPSWYLATGGLRRRLRILTKIADVFAVLHSRAIAYGDPSPWNILVSRDPEQNEVWLIDADNLVFESSPTESALTLFTPGYGAPEVFAGKSGINTLTDAHALSVIAYQMLVLTHPLIGDFVRKGDPELEDAAYSGAIPWIDHPTDTANRSSHGINRDIVLAPRLKRLFERAFGDGLVHPLERPGIAALAEALHSASDFTAKCGSCGATHYANAANCPWCEVPVPPLVLGEVFRWDPADGIGAKRLHAFVIESDASFSVTPRVAGTSWQTGTVELAVTRQGVIAWVTGDASAEISFSNGSRFRPLSSSPTTLSPENGVMPWIVHMREREQAHRVITLARTKKKK